MTTKTNKAWDLVADVDSAEAAALRSVFGTSSFRILGNAGVKEQSARDREIMDAVQEYIADNYLFAVEAHAQQPFTSASFTVPDGDAPVVGWVKGGGQIDRSGGDTAAILAMLSQMTDEQRVQVMEAIQDRYCQHCGRKDEGRMCQCWNDE